MNATRLICLLGLLAILAACGGATNTAEPAAAIPTPTTGPALRPITPRPDADTADSPAAGRDPEKAPELDGAVLMYERYGGLAGIRPQEYVWRLYADGRITSSDGRSWDVPPAEIADLVDAILALGFADLDASYVPENTCCDRVTHVITLQVGDDVRQVTTLDAATAPAAVDASVQLVNDYLLSLPTE